MVMERMTKNILAIIPARGASKGIKNKNIVDISGKPLLAWTIEAALSSKYISQTFVSSDNNKILQIAGKHGASTILRPESLALDTSASEPTIEHTLQSLINENYEYIILLQPTSPLRDSSDIDNAFDLFFQKDATSLISVSKIDKKILKAFKKNDSGFISAISNAEYPFMRRQDLPETFISNGAIYIIKTEEFLKNSSLFTDRCVSFLMDEIKSIDIDTLEDLNRAQRYLK